MFWYSADPQALEAMYARPDKLRVIDNPVYQSSGDVVTSTPVSQPAHDVTAASTAAGETTEGAPVDQQVDSTTATVDEQQTAETDEADVSEVQPVVPVPAVEDVQDEDVIVSDQPPAGSLQESAPADDNYTHLEASADDDVTGGTYVDLQVPVAAESDKSDDTPE